MTPDNIREEEYKGFRIRGLTDFAMVKIMPPGSGDIPAALRGHWTKPDLARQAVDGYLNSLKTKPKRKAPVKKDMKDAEEVSAATS